MADIVGTSNDDILRGTTGDDFIRGLGGNDQIFGRQGNDRIEGGSGNDDLFGEEGRDILAGGTGSDLLSGALGNDRLEGGTGNDILIGGEDNDALLGGAGRDRFVFNPGDGSDTILDFVQGQDKIVFAGFSDLEDFSELEIDVVGADSLILLDNNDGVRVRNVINLNEGDFDFEPVVFVALIASDGDLELA